VLSPRDRRAAARASSSVISPQGKRALARDTASKPSADAESNVLSPRDKRALFRATNTISTATTTTAVHAMADTTTLHENESQDEPSTTANPTTALEAQHENALVEYEPESPLPDRILGNPRNANLPYNALDIYHVLSPFPMNVLQVLSPVQQTPYGTVCHVTFPPIAPVDCQMHEEQILNDNIEEATNNSNNSLNDSGVDETNNNLQRVVDNTMASFFSNFGHATEGAKVGCVRCLELISTGNSELRHSPWCPSQHGRQSTVHKQNITTVEAPPTPQLPVHVATETLQATGRKKTATKKSAASAPSRKTGAAVPAKPSRASASTTV
jgi:hypothetical protein